MTKINVKTWFLLQFFNFWKNTNYWELDNNQKYLLRFKIGFLILEDNLKSDQNIQKNTIFEININIQK